MFFILSKLLDFILSPLFWIILFFTLGVFFQSTARRKLFISIALTCLIFFSNSFIVNEALLIWETKPVAINTLENYDTAIVLTGITNSRNDINDRVFFGRGVDRLLHTVQLYKAGKVRNILISGGPGTVVKNKISEAQELKAVFIYCGVNANDIIMEEFSRNTTESSHFVKTLLDCPNSSNKYLLITSAFHMPRAVGCFQKAGLNVGVYPVDYYSHNRQFDIQTIILPSESALEKWSILIHEFVGYVVYKVMGYT